MDKVSLKQNKKIFTEIKKKIYYLRLIFIEKKINLG